MDAQLFLFFTVPVIFLNFRGSAGVRKIIWKKKKRKKKLFITALECLALITFI